MTSSLLVPKLCLGTSGPEAPLRRTDTWPKVSFQLETPSDEAELRGRAFPSRAWERGGNKLEKVQMTTTRSANALSRRDLLRLTAAGFAGASMSGWLENMAAAAAKDPQRKR